MGDSVSIGRSARWWLAAAVIIVVAALFLRERDDFKPLVVSGETMGTTYRVVLGDFTGGVEAEPDMSPEKTLQAGATAVVDATLLTVNSAFNTYDPESDLSRFNDAAAGEAVEVSEETIELVQRAFDISAATGGAFDPTVGSLVRRWQFGPDRGTLDVPGDEETAKLLELVGTDLVEIDEAAHTLTKTIDGVNLDLSAMAKGHGVDRVSGSLAEIGFEASLVEIGGELYGRGVKPDGSPWLVAVMNPAAPFNPAARGEPSPLTDVGMATSGDYFNYHEVDGERYGHTIDPRTGRPVTHELAAVTVIAPDCATADAVATGLMVMGPTEGYDWATERDVAAVLTQKNGTVRETTCFSQWKASGELKCRPSL